MSELPVYLFVYGTLQPGFVNPFAQLLNQNSQYVGHGTLRGRLYSIGRYPGAVYDANSPSHVQGSIFDISHNPTDLLTHLDEYEGVNTPANPTDEYCRAMVPINYGDDELPCWTYLYNWPVSVEQLIASGNYVNL
ncbi:MAG: gamma-glutamylcyclotransferase [Spirosoma sp.]|nr:gamma-glutamylcyclotransferase [Spirosoma sp.]